MKLNEYITKKLHETWPIDGIPTEERIEKWIVEWYRNTFVSVNSTKPALPPQWLANWREHELD
tara:strand:- start:40 stop:228 length:189 start_codon:yes stop_codon:yes gene_type:complete